MAGFLDNIKSLAPGGAKANWSGLGKNVGTAAYELSGVGDISRGAQELAKGNVAGGLGRLALGAVGFVPGAGLVVKGASAASKLAKGSKMVSAATKIKPVQAAIKPVQTVAKTKPIQVVAKPAQAAGTKVTSGIKTAATKASKPVVGAGAKTKVGKLAAGFTSPYSLSRIVSEYTMPQPNAASASTGAPNIFDAAQRSWNQTQQAAALMGTNVPRTGGGAPGTGGGGTGGGTGGGGTTPPPGTEEPPVLVVPEMPGGDGGTGIQVGGGSEGYGTDEIMTGEDVQYGASSDSMRQAGGAGTPGEVAKAAANYAAGRADLAAQAKSRDAGLRELFSQGLMGARGAAADILGGRSAAIRGQGVTGVRRDYQVGLAQAAQDRIAQESALARTYGNEVAAGYSQAAEDVMNLAKERSATAAKIRSLG